MWVGMIVAGIALFFAGNAGQNRIRRSGQMEWLGVVSVSHICEAIALTGFFMIAVGLIWGAASIS